MSLPNPWSPVVPTWQDFRLVLPEAALVFFGALTLAAGILLPSRRRAWTRRIALIGLAVAVALFALVARTAAQPVSGFSGSIRIDLFFVLFALLCLVPTGLVLVLDQRSGAAGEHRRGESLALILFASAGALLLTCSTDLVALFVSLEVLAASLYGLSLTGDRDEISQRSVRDFVLSGLLGSALVAYSFSLLYALGGSTKLAVIGTRIAAQPGSAGLAYAAMAILCGGLLIKMAAAPFDRWLRSATRGTHWSVSAFATTAARLAFFGVLLRVALAALGRELTALAWIASAIGALSLVVGLAGALAAATHSNLRRLLAFASITQLGYLLLGIAALATGGGSNPLALGATGYYAISYALTQAGAFAALPLGTGEAGGGLHALRGLAHRERATACLLLVFFGSLAAIPPAPGFAALWYLCSALRETGHAALAGIAVAGVLPALYYNFRVAEILWQTDGEGAEPALLRISWPAKSAVAIVAGFSLAVGMFPRPAFEFARDAILSALTR